MSTKVTQSPLTFESLLAEWGKLSEDNGDGMTTAEIAGAVGVSEHKIRAMIKDGITSGKIVARSVKRPNVMRPGWGHYKTTVYEVVK